jgi:hypothetical protein
MGDPVVIEVIGSSDTGARRRGIAGGRVDWMLQGWRRDRRTLDGRVFMDDAEISADERELPTGNGDIPTGEPPLLVGPDATMTSSSAPATGGRRVPLWAALVGAVAGVLLAFGVGFAINAGDADDVRDELNAEIDSLNEELASSQTSLQVAEGSLAECQDAVEGAAGMAEAAEDLASDWEQQGQLIDDWFAAPVGSSEEAQAEAALVELEGQMTTKFGGLSAMADRVTSDSEACLAA